MDGIGRKTRKSNRRLSATERHARWTDAFFDSAGFKADTETGEPNYFPGLPNRRYAPSRGERRTLAAMRRFERDLTKACERLDRALRIKGRSKSKWWGLLAEIHSEANFREAIHQNTTKGRVQVIPSFIALLILAGFKLHSGNSDEHEGQRLMRVFFDANGEFQQGITRLYEIDHAETLIKSLCGKDSGKPLSKWVKNFRDRADENFLLPNDDRRKTAKERSLKGLRKDIRRPTEVERSAEMRIAEVNARIENLVRRILRKAKTG